MVVFRVILAVIFLCTVAASRDDPLPPSGECVSGAYPPNESSKAPVYTVDLDLPADQRWTQIASEKKSQILNVIDVVRNFSMLLVGDKIMKLIDDYLPNLLQNLPEPYISEMRSIANVTGIPIGEIITLNLFYELKPFCTSIIAQDQKGQLYHGRNLDFGLLIGWDLQNHTWPLAEALRSAIIQVEFRRQGKTLFISAQFAGYVGVLTAVKPNLFSLSIDSRFSAKSSYIDMILNMHSKKWMAFTLREVMENSIGYNDALDTLSKSNLLAPAYFILGGNMTNQACIITKDSGTTDSYVLTMEKSGNDWFLVETNYDPREKPPNYDDRRTPSVKCLKQLTQQNVSFAGLFNVLSTQPVLSKLTSYTSLMSVASGQMETYVQNCQDPCYLF